MNQQRCRAQPPLTRRVLRKRLGEILPGQAAKAAWLLGSKAALQLQSPQRMAPATLIAALLMVQAQPQCGVKLDIHTP